MTEEIFELAKTLGRVEPGDEERLRALCASAAEELRGRLRAGVTAQDCAPALRMGAAWLALAALCAGAGAGQTEVVSAGGVTIRQEGGKSRLERSQGLRRQGELVMAPYLEDRGFAFSGVRG